MLLARAHSFTRGVKKCINSVVITLSSFLKWELITLAQYTEPIYILGRDMLEWSCIYNYLATQPTCVAYIRSSIYIFMYARRVIKKRKTSTRRPLWTRQESKHPTALRNENEFQMSRHRPDILPNQIASAIFERHKERTTCVMSPGPNSWGLSC